MKAFETFTGIIAPLDRSNVDTDAIIPKEYLKSIKRTGFGDNLFDAWRYLNENHISETNNHKKRLNTNFVLNIQPYCDAEILLARDNFGCGSSREHAVWALSDFGFKSVIAPSFGDIFYSNSFKNGFLPIRLQKSEIDALFDLSKSLPGFKVTINLKKQFVETQDKTKFNFDIDSSSKIRLLEGLDDVSLTLKHTEAIRSYEMNRAKLTPWLFKDI